MTTIKKVAFDALQICMFSGCRGRGVEKLLQENAELFRVIRQADDVLINFPWIEGYVHDFEAFFKSIAEAIQEDFPDVNTICKTDENFPKTPEDLAPEIAERCLKKILICCGPNGEVLFKHQNQNRHLFTFIKFNPEVKKRIFFCSGWLEENEAFFEELRQTVKCFILNDCYEKKLRPWMGEDYSPYWITRRKQRPAYQQDDEGNLEEKPEREE